MTELVFFIGIVLLAGLAIIGLLVVTSPGETVRQRYAREAREAERRITDIGRQAQAAILAEALKRAQQRPQPSPQDQVRGDLRNPYGHGGGQFGSWAG